MAVRAWSHAANTIAAESDRDAPADVMVFDSNGVETNRDRIEQDLSRDVGARGEMNRLGNGGTKANAEGANAVVAGSTQKLGGASFP